MKCPTCGTQPARYSQSAYKIHAMYSKHSQQKYVYLSLQTLLNIATVVNTKIKTLHGEETSSDFNTCPDAQQQHCVWKEAPSQTRKSEKNKSILILVHYPDKNIYNARLITVH